MQNILAKINKFLFGDDEISSLSTDKENESKQTITAKQYAPINSPHIVQFPLENQQDNSPNLNEIIQKELLKPETNPGLGGSRIQWFPGIAIDGCTEIIANTTSSGEKRMALRLPNG